MDRDQYEEDLKRRQKEHLDNVERNQKLNWDQNNNFKYSPPWQPCMHDQCTECIGTGIRGDGSSCIHYIYCPCPKCSPYISTINYRK